MHIRKYGGPLTLVLCLAAAAAMPGCSVVTHAGDYQTQECATNADCIAARGANFICRKTDKTCQGLVTDDCKTVLGSDNLKEEDSILMGALFAINGANASTGKGEVYGLNMAFSDFATAAGGLPPLPGATKRRQIAVLVCDDSSANDVALRSVNHMVTDLGIQTLVGPTWSGPTINFLTQTTIAAGTLVIASGTTSPDLTSLQKNNLFYRTSESTTLEAPPIARLAGDIEAVLGRGAVPVTTKMALLYKGDSFGKGTAQAIASILTLNGKPANDPSNQGNYLQLDYGNSSDPKADPLKYTDTAAKVIALQPHIVITIGTSEMFGNVMGLIEQGWPGGGTKRPFWIYPHTGVTSALVTQLKTLDTTDDLRKRILGVTYGSNSKAYLQFRTNFVASQPNDVSPDAIDANTTYDAFYVAAYAVASIGAQPLTGANIAAGIANLVPPAGQTKITVGPSDINQALTLLTQGQKINLEGTSGPLDFNLQTGDVAQENQVWCIPLGKDNLPAFPTFSGYGFDLNNKSAGSIQNVTTACGIAFPN